LHGNAIIESFNDETREIKVLDRKLIKTTKYNRSTVQWNCFNGQGALDAIYDTGGLAIGISDDELKSYLEKFKKLVRRIRVGIRDSYPISALYKMASSGELSNGNHVLILNNGMVDIDIRDVKKRDLNISYNEFLQKLDTWLIRFTDPMEEIEEAVADAFENGHVVCAYQGNTLVGIAIVSTTKYETFFPKYHLSYIATKMDIKGMGIATQLIQKVIELTDGDLSLHVETDNKRAIKLYEKMGLKKRYYRMFYQGKVISNGSQD
jgi:threonine synthase